MRHFLLIFFYYFWAVWLALLVIVDPICVYLGNRYHVGDKLTDTHFIATHVGMGVRFGIYAWLGYHFFVQHRNG